MGDEKLTALGILASRSQAEAAFQVVQLGQLGAQGVGGAAGAVAARVAALGHEVGNDAVEIQAIVEAGPRQGHEAAHGPRRVVHQQRHHQFPLRGAEPDALACRDGFDQLPVNRVLGGGAFGGGRGPGGFFEFIQGGLEGQPRLNIAGQREAGLGRVQGGQVGGQGSRLRARGEGGIGQGLGGGRHLGQVAAGQGLPQAFLEHRHQAGRKSRVSAHRQQRRQAVAGHHRSLPGGLRFGPHEGKGGRGFAQCLQQKTLFVGRGGGFVAFLQRLDLAGRAGGAGQAQGGGQQHGAGPPGGQLTGAGGQVGAGFAPAVGQQPLGGGQGHAGAPVGQGGQHRRPARGVKSGLEGQCPQGHHPHPRIGVVGGQAQQRGRGLGRRGSLVLKVGCWVWDVGCWGRCGQCGHAAQGHGGGASHGKIPVFRRQAQQRGQCQPGQISIQPPGAGQGGGGGQASPVGQVGEVGEQRHGAAHGFRGHQPAHGQALQAGGQGRGPRRIGENFYAPEFGHRAAAHAATQGLLHGAAHPPVGLLQHPHAQAVHGRRVGGLAQGVSGGAAHGRRGIAQQRQQRGHRRRGLHRAESFGSSGAIGGIFNP